MPAARVLWPPAEHHLPTTLPPSPAAANVVHLNVLLVCITASCNMHRICGADIRTKTHMVAIIWICLYVCTCCGILGFGLMVPAEQPPSIRHSSRLSLPPQGLLSGRSQSEGTSDTGGQSVYNSVSSRCSQSTLFLMLDASLMVPCNRLMCWHEMMVHVSAYHRLPFTKPAPGKPKML